MAFINYFSSHALALWCAVVAWCGIGIYAVKSECGESTLTQTPLFISGEDGYNTYRIPALIITNTGSVIAFCEGRRSGAGDAGDIDVVAKRSTDGGLTWSVLKTVFDDDKNTCGNPCPVVDQTTGTIWLLLTHNAGTVSEGAMVKKTGADTRTVWVCNSTDDGQTWSQPINITESVKDPRWGWYATGPGIGIQLQHGPQAGRLLIPTNMSYDAEKGALHGAFNYGALAIFSDDNGKTWHKSQNSIGPGANESQLVELSDGRVILNTRMQTHRSTGGRGISTSTDGGVTWAPLQEDTQLPDPICQGSVIRFDQSDPNGAERLLFSNPGQPLKTKSGIRANMTVRLSQDGGKTWPIMRSLSPDKAAYSCLGVLADKTILCLYEAGEKKYHESIRLARFSLSWVMGQ